MITADITNIFATIGGSSIISSTVTYLFAKRKYKAETETTEIKNLKESIDVYKVIIDDLKAEYKEVKAQQKELIERMDKMKNEFDKKLQRAKDDCKENN